MSTRRSYRRFPDGQRCEQCPSKRWYSESGHRYCDRGHEIEGFVEQAFEDENAFGQTGHVAHREKKSREKVSLLLSGDAARELYLECLQLILRKQVYWLVHDRGLPAELETVVRDLWDLRVRNLAGLRRVAEGAGTDPEAHEEEGGYGTGRSLDSELQLFSSDVSGAETDGGDEARSEATTATAASTIRRARSWNTDISSSRRLPRLIDALGLCYLACLLMRLPVRVGDLFRWAKDNKIPYLDAVSELPREMRGRLPGQYQSALSARVMLFEGGELHQAVIHLAGAFRTNHQLLFPPLNEPLILMRYTTELALPAEVYAYARGMFGFLNADFTFPLERRRIHLVDHPDILLVACVILTTKMLCPFRADHDADTSIGMDWQEWAVTFREPPRDELGRRELAKLDPEDAWTMSQAKINDYLNWYQQVRIDEQRLDSEMARFAALFPLEDLPSKKSTEHEALDDEAVDEGAIRLQGRLTRLSDALLRTEGRGDDNAMLKKFGKRHPIYRTVDDLPETARLFYDKAGELAGVSTAKLVRAVCRLEGRLKAWIEMQQAKSKG